MEVLYGTTYCTCSAAQMIFALSFSNCSQSTTHACTISDYRMTKIFSGDFSQPLSVSTRNALIQGFLLILWPLILFLIEY